VIAINVCVHVFPKFLSPNVVLETFSYLWEIWIFEKSMPLLYTLY
jgi:hypothetical protein